MFYQENLEFGEVVCVLGFIGGGCNMQKRHYTGIPFSWWGLDCHE